MKQKNSAKKERGDMVAPKKETPDPKVILVDSGLHSVVPSESHLPIREKKSPASGDDLEVSYYEAKVSELLGLPIEDLIWLRKGLLELGHGFHRNDGGVQITGAGLREIEEALSENKTLICVKSNLPNPQLVLARHPGNDQIVRCRVADSSPWCKGMIMTDCTAAAGAFLYVCMTRPKFKGRI